MTDDVVQSLWDEHVAWSGTAARLKSRRTHWRNAVLTLTVLGAALQTTAATMKAAQLPAGLAGTVALALVPLMVRYFLTSEETRKWLRARSVSEGIKSEIYRYRAGAEPYAGSDALAVLRRKVKDIRTWGKDLELERARIGSPTKPAPSELDTDAYLQQRIRQQVKGYYRPNAQKNARLAERYRWAEIALAALAAALSAVATFFGDPGSATLGPWVAVLTTVGGSIAAHAAAGRFDFQAATYFATARQLEDLALEWETCSQKDSPKEWSEFVRACEEAISAENRGWMAKFDEKT
ncbi:MAG: DUF4231 domain-containing protein [Xanthobacteraceae bacterium]